VTMIADVLAEHIDMPASVYLSYARRLEWRSLLRTVAMRAPKVLAVVHRAVAEIRPRARRGGHAARSVLCGSDDGDGGGDGPGYSPASPAEPRLTSHSPRSNRLATANVCLPGTGRTT